MTQRSCGSCSLCCKLFAIDELAKPEDVWCQHCRPGKGGCSVYAARPEGCRTFVCSWLNGQLPDSWYPPRSKMVARFILSGKGVPLLDIRVDTNYPNRWREEPYYSSIKRASAWGMSLPEDEVFATRVSVGDKIFFVFPTREIERKSEINADEKRAIEAEFVAACAEFDALRQLPAGGAP
jgi:hypothetical protein